MVYVFKDRVEMLNDFNVVVVDNVLEDLELDVLFGVG